MAATLEKDLEEERRERKEQAGLGGFGQAKIQGIKGLGRLFFPGFRAQVWQSFPCTVMS